MLFCKLSAAWFAASADVLLLKLCLWLCAFCFLLFVFARAAVVHRVGCPKTTLFSARSCTLFLSAYSTVPVCADEYGVSQHRLLCAAAVFSRSALPLAGYAARLSVLTHLVFVVALALSRLLRTSKLLLPRVFTCASSYS